MPKRRRPSQRPLPPDHYFVRSQQPLASLVFLLPLIVVYEVGVWRYAEPTGRRLSAWAYVRDFLELFGVEEAGAYLPGLAVIVVLLSWHIARGERWRFEPRVYAGMAIESLALAAPLLMLGLLTGPRRAAAVVAAAGPELAAGELADLPWQAALVFSIGAGIYEELVFRLAAIALLHMLLVDLLKTPEKRGAMIAIVISAVLFAGLHFGGGRAFDWHFASFFFLAGLYFAVIYVVRGFGIVAATHAFYDVMIVAISHLILTGR